TTATGGTFTYDGDAHGGSGSVDVAGARVTLSYLGINGTTYSSTAAPTNAGAYLVTATYAGDASYTGSSGSALLTICKAASTTTVTGDSFTYDSATRTGGSAVVNGAGVVTGTAVLRYSGDQVNAGSYTVIAT